MRLADLCMQYKTYYVDWQRWPTAPRADGHWYLDDFGAADNGSEAKAAFARLGRAMRAYGHHVPQSVRFTDGKKYWTSEPYHFTGLTRLTIDGQGAQLVAAGFVTAKNYDTIAVQHPFLAPPADIETELDAWNEHTEDYGYLIDSVAAGAMSITLKTPSDADHFTVGRYAFLYGLSIQRPGGFPPNAKFFEWPIAATKNATTGVVTFNAPLEFAYSDTWYDGYGGVGPFGAARIIPWEDRGCPVDLTIRNMEVVPLRNTGLSDDIGNFGLNAVNLTYDTVTGAQLALDPSMSKNLVIVDCQADDIELDKLVDTCTITDSTFNQSIAGTGVRNLITSGIEILEDGNAQFVGQNITHVNAAFPDEAAIYRYAGGNISITDCSVSGQFSDLMFRGDPLSVTQTDTYTVTDSGGVSTALVFAGASVMYNRFDIGTRLWLKRRSSAGMVLATITAWEQGAAGEDVFLISCSDLVLANSVILSASQFGYLFRDIAQLDGGGPVPKANGYTYIDWVRHSGLCEMRMADNLYETALRGWASWRRAVTLNSITINVSTAYTGTDTTPKLILQSRAADLATWDGSTTITRDMSIDLRTAGVRTITTGAAGTVLGTDSLAWNAYRSGSEVMLWNGFSVSGDLGAGKIIGDSANSPNQAVMPQVAVTFTFTPVVS